MSRCVLIIIYLAGCGVKTAPPPPVTPENMVLIPAGEFQMGSLEGSFNESPVHTVFIDAFYIDKYEVTNAQYKDFVNANPQRYSTRAGT